MIMVDEIANKTGLSRANVRKVLNAQQDICAKKLRDGEGVNIMGVGIKRNKASKGEGYAYRVYVGNKLRTAVDGE